jgi:hypothetical protein
MKPQPMNGARTLIARCDQDFADLAADVPPPAEGEPAEGEPAEEEPAEEELAEEAELPKKETKGKKKK